MRRSLAILLLLAPRVVVAQEAKALEKADAEYKAQRWAEAYEAYDDARKSYALSGAKKAQVDARIKELEPKVALLTVRSNEGAEVTVDGAPRGAAPVTLRVAAGKHVIELGKHGYESARREEDVRGGGRTTVEIMLVASATTGRLSVREREGRPARVLIDGKEVGVAPWEGDVAPGEHAVALAGEGVSASGSVTVARGERAELELSAAGEKGAVEITTSDGEGDIFIDGRRVGAGAFRDRLAPGRHRLEVKREGFVSDDEIIEVGAGSLAKTITLTRASKAPAKGDVSEVLGGFYGGVQFFGAFAPRVGSSFEDGCALFGGTSCSAPGPAGAGLGLTFGYTWDPIGFEIFAAGMADYAEPKATYDGVVRAGSNALLTGPARVESWRVLRYGGMGALRVRATWSSRLLRLTLALGPGFSYRSYVSDRRMVSADGHYQDTFAPDQAQSGSPALSIEAAAHLRASRKLAFSLGVMVWLESAGDGVTTNADPNRLVYFSPMKEWTLAYPLAIPLRTPSYRLASGTQTYVGPFVGVVFGP